MPRWGGDSDKYGNRFEGKWTACCLADLLKGNADAICLEPPGDESEGAEFWLRRGSITEYHQVKRQHSSLGGWTIPELSRIGVLKTAYERTRNTDSEFVFISTISSGGLEELRDLAQRGASYVAVREELKKGSRKDAWQQLLCVWQDYLVEDVPDDSSVNNVAEERERLAFDHLTRLHLHWYAEGDLTEHVDTKMQTLSREPGNRTRKDLLAFALEHLMCELFGDTLWEHLVTLGHTRVDFGADKAVIAAMAEQNARYAILLKPIESLGFIDRGEVSRALDALLTGEGRKSVLLSGAAGVGKSAALGQLIHRIKEQEIPHLYFRLDRLNPTPIPENIGVQLGLPTSPVEVLASVAKGRRCVLIIDQLDAVSTVSGRNPDFFECVHEIIRKVSVFSEMRLVMACRRFDLEKDNRLRELVGDKGCAQEVPIELLSEPVVELLLRRICPRHKSSTGEQLELLRLPLHLSIFVELMRNGAVDGLELSTPLALFSAYWDYKVEAVTKRLEERENNWARVIDVLCKRMTQEQTLFVHEHVILDDYRGTVRVMESEGVLILDSGKVGFFHESFFDYCFARGFLRRGGKLLSFIMDGEQHLFKRAPLRQVLTHMHDSDEGEYTKQVDQILSDPDVRYHIKKAALEAVDRIDAPSDALWKVFSRFMREDCEGIAREIRGILIGSRKWFQFLNEKGVLEAWLADESNRCHRTGKSIVATHLMAFPKEAVALYRPYIGKSSEWAQAMIHAMWMGTRKWTREVFDLFMELIERGQLDCEMNEHQFWMCLRQLTENQPEWAAFALGLHLRKELEKIDSVNRCGHMLKEDQSGAQNIIKIAEAVPNTFLEQMLPQVLSLVTETAKERDGKLFRDSIWGYRSYKEEYMSMEESLLAACSNALRVLANTGSGLFVHWVERLWEFGDYDTINFLLINGFSVVSASGANLAVEYLLENPQRMECGWGMSGGGEASYWAGHECIGNISQFCSDMHMERLCTGMAEYFPQWERTAGGHAERGHWQMVMLSALEPSRRTAAVKSRIEEWRRKYPGWRLKPPLPLSAGWVGPPVSSDAVTHMTDQQWLKAMRTYNAEDRHSPKDHLKGGAFQLSSELEKATKSEPKRFAALACTFTSEYHTCYFDAVLRGLKESCAGGDEIYPVVRHFFSLPGKPGSRWMSTPIGKLRAEEIPDDILSIVGWLATESNDPEPDKLLVHSGKEGDRPSPHDLVSSAINCTRGSAASAVGELLFEDSRRKNIFLPYLERMVRDQSVAVRTTVAEAVLGLFKHDESCAVELFHELCDMPCDELLATPEVSQFMRYAQYRHYGDLRPIMERMIHSESEKVRETGAKHLALAQFRHVEAIPLVEQCMNGDSALRMGVAQVAEVNVFHVDCYPFCSRALTRLFNDPVKEIRNEASDCFRRAEGRDLDTCRDLITVFIKSTAFLENSHDLTWAMQRSTADLDEEILMVGDAVIEALKVGVGNRSGDMHLSGKYLAELLLRAYSQSKDSAFKSRCLDMIDQMLLLGVYDIQQELESLER